MPSLVRNAGVGGATTNLTGLNCTTALTVAIWARLTGSSTSTDVIRHASTANAARDGYRVGFNATEMRLDILGATGSQNYAAISGSPHRDGRWHHLVATYDSVSNRINGYRDGHLVTYNTTVTQDISANASCTTTLNPNVIGNGFGFLFFDFQILPNVVVPASDVRLLMNPRYTYPGVMGRYWGLQFRTTTGTGPIRDESGNGNNLTITQTIQQGEEPPYLPTIG